MKLFEKTRIGGMELRNRIYMCPMGISTDLDGGYNQRNINYYVERAKGGVGLIFTAANLATDKFESRAGNMLSEFQHVERVHQLADNIHFYGAKFCVQISAGLGRVGAADPFTPPYSSSATHSFWFPNLICKPFSVEQIKELEARIGYSALLAVQAGADAVELHAYGGYLIDQFQTSLWNLRDDEYGGSLENRMRFTLEIIAEMRKNVGPKIPILVKFTPYHGIPGGREIEEGIEMAKMLEAAGVDALHIDYGCYEAWYNAIPTVYQPDATQIGFAKQIRENVHIPVLSQGKLSKPEVAEKALEDGCADLVGLGHQLLADPFWPTKVKGGMSYDIIPCIGCNECLRGDFAGIGCECAVNPYCAYEQDYKLEPGDPSKKVLVAGGGPGGVQAAITAARRGYDVELWEKKPVIGGNLRLAGAPSFKSDVMRYADYLSGKVLRSGIKVRLGKEATVDEIKREGFDAVIVATGSHPSVPPISGIDLPNVTYYEDVLTGGGTGDTCVVIGGGLVGCETALMLNMDRSKKVYIVEMLDRILAAGDDALNNDLMIRHMLDESGIEIILSAKITGITGTGVTYEKDGASQTISCDTVVVASGHKPNQELTKELEEAGIYTVAIGDSKQPRKIFNAVHEGFHTARLLFNKEEYANKY